jgi:undecaprenyl diphosphate synthase
MNPFVLDARSIPHHVAIIMDGNGRWAEGRGFPRLEGHKEGAKTVRRIVTVARKLGLRALTLYAFSEQNWLRPEEEVDGLMHLLREFLKGEKKSLLENHIRLDAVGNLGRLPKAVRTVLDAVRSATKEGDGMTLTLALSYGGREEIANAARELAVEVLGGRLRPHEVTCEALRKRMPSLRVGDPDLVIRTGGEQRISNFLLYGLAYAELVFTRVQWPEFSEKDLVEAIASYQGRERRFGNIDADRGTATVH